MSYTDYGFYCGLYPQDAIDDDYLRLSWEAARELDRQTTGVDNVCKLKAAFPTNEDDAEAVRRCECALVHLLYQIEQAEEAAATAASFVTREDGTVTSRLVTSISSGRESLGFSSGGSSGRTTAIDAAVSDRAARERLFADTVRQYLSGVTDANGVNLLYMGRYPYVSR